MSDQYVGEIRMFAGNYPPQGWAFCDGTILQINGNEALYSLIGTIYGGDGKTNFALPDLRGRIPIHFGQNPTSTTTYSLGQKGGTEKVTLNTEQLPKHTHQVAASSTGGAYQSPANGYWANSTTNQYAKSDTVPSTTMKASSIESVGGNLPHDNIMPLLTLSFIIATEGLYPTQG